MLAEIDRPRAPDPYPGPLPEAAGENEPMAAAAAPPAEPELTGVHGLEIVGEVEYLEA